MGTHQQSVASSKTCSDLKNEILVINFKFNFILIIGKQNIFLHEKEIEKYFDH